MRAALIPLPVEVRTPEQFERFFGYEAPGSFSVAPAAALGRGWCRIEHPTEYDLGFSAHWGTYSFNAVRNYSRDDARFAESLERRTVASVKIWKGETPGPSCAIAPEYTEGVSGSWSQYDADGNLVPHEDIHWLMAEVARLQREALPEPFYGPSIFEMLAAQPRRKAAENPGAVTRAYAAIENERQGLEDWARRITSERKKRP